MEINHEIYDILPTAEKEDVRREAREIDGSLYHVQIEGGNFGFYDKQGGKVLRDVVKKTELILIRRSKEFGIQRQEITSEYGDIHFISKNKPEFRVINVNNEQGEPLEVRLTISEVK